MLRMMLVMVLTAGFAGADDRKTEKKEEKKGTVTGILTAKDDNGKWIEVKADGEEKARKYVPHWKGGQPKDGGGLDKEVVAKIRETAVESRVRIEWEHVERYRVVKIELLKKETKPGKK